MIYYGDKGAKRDAKPVWTSPLFPFQILREVIRDKPDVIHLQFELYMFGATYTNLLIPVLLFLIKLLRKKLVVTIHGVIPRSMFDAGRIGKVLPKDVISNLTILKLEMFCMYWALNKLSSKIIVHSNIFKRWLWEYLINPDKIFVIPHGTSTDREVVSVDRWKDLGSRIILNFGVLTPRKGLETLIPAFCKLNCPNAVLLIVGREMPYYVGYPEKIKNIVKRKGIEDKVIFTGFLPDNEVHYLFEKAEFVVLPYSISISASGALSFAVQHCKPTIVTNTEFFEEEFGEDEVFFVPVDDVEALKNAMQRLLQGEALRRRLSEAFRRKAERNSWEKAAKKILEVYN